MKVEFNQSLFLKLNSSVLFCLLIEIKKVKNKICFLPSYYPPLIPPEMVDLCCRMSNLLSLYIFSHVVIAPIHHTLQHTESTL